ncbi:hypothetical protein [Vibrio owensii]|uniref:hypothetical protein n=1 Tax=Vibrio owensii TaxID=696485 RepID=UPI0018F1788E|nr:hypothetical protein [Vibrio owensii]
MSTNKSLELINAVTAGRVAPSYSSFGIEAITYETYRGYVDMAHRLAAKFGTSEHGFKSIGQMKQLIKLSAGRNKIDILGAMPGVRAMSKSSLVSHVERVSPLITEHEIVKGKLLLPDMSGFTHYDQITVLATEFVYKLYMLNVRNSRDLEALADDDLWSAFAETNKEWGEHLYDVMDSTSYFNFWCCLVCMFYHIARQRVNSKELRDEMSGYAQKQGVMKRVAFICASDALEAAVLKGRM